MTFLYVPPEHLVERQCVQNAFSAKALRPLLKETIQTVSRYALTNQEEFLARLQREMLAEQPEQTKQLKKGIAAKNKRVAELDRLLKKLYENYALEKIPEERFDALSAEYESEQEQLEKAVLEEQRQINSEIDYRDGMNGLWRLLSATATARNIPMKCCVNSWKKSSSMKP